MTKTVFLEPVHPVSRDASMSGLGWWAHRYTLDFLTDYKGKWCVTFALPGPFGAPGINFPAVIDDYGNLVRVT